MNIFEKDGDFLAFLKLLEEARLRFNMRVLGYCLMHNHWHMILWPRRAGDLSRFIQWISSTHVRRWRQHRDSVGEGHLYQGRFKSFPIEDDRHLLTVLRYVEANPRRANLVSRAQTWPWSSLSTATPLRVTLAPWPVDRPTKWIDMVNHPLPTPDMEQLRRCIKRGQPFGGLQWVRSIARRLGLQSTLRDPWRPRKTSRAIKKEEPKGRGGR